MSRIKGGMLFLSLAAAGCTTVEPEGYPLSATVKDCLAQSSQFIDAWGCVQSRYASGKMGNADRRITAFLKLGDDLAGEVAAKKLTDKEAKSRLSAGTEDLDKM
jgi:hypothetical protein